MDTPQQRPKLIKKNVGKALKWLLGALLALFISVFIALQLPYVQNYLFKKFLRHLSHTTSLTITHQHFQLSGLSKGTITGLNVQNDRGSTILDTAQVVLRIDPWQQLRLMLGNPIQRGASLQVQADKLRIDIHHLTGNPIQQALLVETLSTSLRLASGRVACQALGIRTQRSTLQGDCTVTYDASASPAALYESAHITADITKSTIASEDLGLFLPYFKPYEARYHFSGTIEGKLDDLHLKNFRFDLADSGNYLQGNCSLQGLPDLRETVFNMELQQGRLQTQDLLPYLNAKHHHLLSRLAYVRPQGHIYGKYDDFTAQATFNTDLGQVSTDLRFELDSVSQLATYKGALATDGFELGKWLNNQSVRQLSMQGQIDGQGLSLDTAHCQLKATIDKLGWHSYEYRNIDAQGTFTQFSFKGRVIVNDPNLQCQAHATIALSKDQEDVAIQGVVALADLQALQLTDLPFTFNTELVMKLQGFSLDHGQADAQLNGLCLGLADKQVQLGTLHFHTGQNDRGRSITLDSALVALKAEGDFAYAALVNDFKQFAQSFQHQLTHTVPLPTQQASKPYTIAYQVHCKDINPLLGILKPDIYVSSGARLEGSFSQDQSSTFSLKMTQISRLGFKQYTSRDTQFTLQASRTQEAILATAQLVAKEQKWGTVSTKEDFTLDISWENDRIDFGTTLGQGTAPHQLCLQGHADLLGNTVAILIDPSSTQLFDQKWHIHPENRITLSNSQAAFQNFEWSSKKQKISLDGVLSNDYGQILNLKVNNFALDNLNLFLGKSLTGALNATAVLQGAFGQAHIDSDITVDQLTINAYTIGDIRAKTNWQDASKRLSLEGQLAYASTKTVAFQGFYEPQAEESLQLVAYLSKAPLVLLEPLANQVFSQLTGDLTGKLSISGSPTNPQIAGSASVSNATVKVDYLQTLYQAHGTLSFANQLIKVDQLSLTDDQQGQAELRGLLAYKDFKELHLDLRGKMVRFKLLNTGSEDNEDIYGIGIMSGVAAMKGAISQLSIDIKAKTEIGTSISIPFGRTDNTVTHAEFIRFVNDKRVPQSPKIQPTNFNGVKLAMLLDITPDALTEIILNEGGGDAIRGRGQGQLKIAIDTQGSLSVAGGFEFSEGEYNFSIYRIVNKTFKILPQSKITWTDKPSEGVLDVRAAYEQRVALPSLSEARQKLAGERYPVQVVVALRGALLAPEMGFEVNFLEAPSNLASQTAISAFQQKAEDKLYLEQQVMSLVIFKRFSEENIIAVDRGAVSRSLSELTSRQLNNLVSGLDERLEVEADVDLEKLEDKGVEGVRFKLSRSFLDGRLRISREGGLGIDAVGETSPAQILGNLAVEYFLTQDGGLRAKFYNKQVTGPAYIGGETPFDAVSGGVSLIYTKSFDYFPSLSLKKWRKWLFGDMDTGLEGVKQERIEELR